MNNNPFYNIASILASLPNIGIKSAYRIIAILSKEKKITSHLIKEFTKILEKSRSCEKCNNISFNKICNICNDYNRDHNQICIVNDIVNLWAIENTKLYSGIFHILDNKNIIENSEYIEEELGKCINNEPQEFIIAMNPTIEGQAVVHYIQKVLKKYNNVTISSLSLGLPMGSSLDYLDSGTISIALESRNEL